jgi:hypothetical protein
MFHAYYDKHDYSKRIIKALVTYGIFQKHLDKHVEDMIIKTLISNKIKCLICKFTPLNWYALFYHYRISHNLKVDLKLHRSSDK